MRIFFALALCLLFVFANEPKSTAANTSQSPLESWKDIKSFYFSEYYFAPHSGTSNLSSRSYRIETIKQFDVGEEYYINASYYKIKAGFDCTKAHNKAEKIICASAALANNDRMINVLYFGLREHIQTLTFDEIIETSKNLILRH